MILKSKAFWTAITDAVISLILLVIGLKWPEYKELALTVIGYIQPVILILIAAFTVDDVKQTWARVKEMEFRVRAMRDKPGEIPF